MRHPKKVLHLPTVVEWEYWNTNKTSTWSELLNLLRSITDVSKIPGQPTATYQNQVYEIWCYSKCGSKQGQEVLSARGWGWNEDGVFSRSFKSRTVVTYKSTPDSKTFPHLCSECGSLARNQANVKQLLEQENGQVAQSASMEVDFTQSVKNGQLKKFFIYQVEYPNLFLVKVGTT